MTIKKIVSNDSFLLLLSTPIVILVVNWLLQAWIYQANSYNYLLLNSGFSQQIFWLSSPGIAFKCLIDILLSSVTLYAAAVVLHTKVSFPALAKIVYVAYFVFLLQMVVEAIIIKNNWMGVSSNTMQSFSFLSVAFFLQLFDVSAPAELGYAMQVLSVFELVFVLIIFLLLHRKMYMTHKRAAVSVAIGYIFPLLLWLMVVSIMILLKSGA
jgi:hypothetical protein